MTRAAASPDTHRLAARLSPLALGVSDRLLWAIGLSAILWLTVWWALS